MSRDELEDLLRQADLGAPAGPTGEAIVVGVRRKLRRRQAARTAGMGFVSALLLVVWISFPFRARMDGHPLALVKPAPEEESPRLAELTAGDILRLREQDQRVAQSRQIDPLVRLRVEIDTMNRMTREFQGEIK